MGTRSEKLMKIFLLAVLFLAFDLSLAQPVITSISPTSTQAGEKITITGTDMGTNPRVFFGGVESPSVNVVNTARTIVEAEVPVGALHEPITVMNDGGKIGESSSKFFIGFAGNNSSKAALTFKSEYKKPISKNEFPNAYDVCICNIDGDSLNDVIVTHNKFGSAKLGEFTYFINESTSVTDLSLGTPISVDLTGQFSIVAGFSTVECGDLDNNGDNDFVFLTSEATTTSVYVFDSIRSATTPSLTLDIPKTANNDSREPSGLQIYDLNGDGFKDIIVGNNTDNTIHIFQNKGVVGDIRFEDALEITVAASTRTSSIEISDLNNDQLPDIVIVPFAVGNEKIYVLKNNSISDNISFLPQVPIDNKDTRRNLKVGDFDNDGFADLATTADASRSSRTGVERISIFRNTSSTSSDISFSLVEHIDIPQNQPFDLDLGDLNGDGKLDIALTSHDIDASASGGAIYTLENNSSSTISFKNPIKSVIERDANNIQIGDLNKDGKADIAYAAGIDRGTTGYLGVIQNNTCIFPFIMPVKDTYCNQESFTLSTINAPNSTYRWSSSPLGLESQNRNEATFKFSQSTSTVEIKVVLQTGSACRDSTSITLNPPSDPRPARPSINVGGKTGNSICEGEEITLTTNGNFDTYLWTLPNGSESAEANITMSEIKASDAGTYSLSVKSANSCFSELGTQTLEIQTFATPVISISNNKDLVFCEDINNSPELEIDEITGGGYQWKRNRLDIVGRTNPSMIAIESGDYTVEVTKGGCTKESARITLEAVEKPVSSFSEFEAICSNIETRFSASSTGVNGYTLEYNWRIDSAGNELDTFTTPDFDYIFNSPTTFNYDVVLTTKYDPNDLANCSDVKTSTINVSPPPTLNFNEADGAQKCVAESIDLSISNAGIDSYIWSTRNAALKNDTLISENASNSSTFALSTPIGVDSVFAILSVETDIGCLVSDSIKIKNIPTPGDIKSPDFESIKLNNSAKLDEAISIVLSADSIVSDFEWKPAVQIDNSSASLITFFPQNPSTKVILTGKDNNGCLVSSQVTIILDNIRPKKTFSPNGDGINDCWEILNIGDLGNTDDNKCEVFIFDSRGRNIEIIREFENENCVWEGNFNGSAVPEGVYYFVLKCTQKEYSKSGSVILAR